MMILRLITLATMLVVADARTLPLQPENDVKQLTTGAGAYCSSRHVAHCQSTRAFILTNAYTLITRTPHARAMTAKLAS